MSRKDALLKKQLWKEKIIFELVKHDIGDDVVSVSKLLMKLNRLGFRHSDPRLREVLQRLEEASIKGKPNKEFDPANAVLKKEDFFECIRCGMPLILKALQNKVVIPEWKHFCQSVSELYEELKLTYDGNVADYIPQLAKVKKNSWGIAVCTIDGQQKAWGDCKVPWCLQSVSKPFAYGIALDLLGNDAVHNYVGQEPTGRLFNEICLDSNNRPHNPMVNAGAIIVSALLSRGGPLADRFEIIMNYLKRMAGRRYMGFNNPVYVSERETADRNYALSYYMKEHKCFPPDTNMNDALDLYFQLCSVEVTCQSAAVMAATLANGGVCPITGDKILRHQSVRDVLSLMFSCGMYDYSGQFAFKVGLPAKSGVSGAMILVIPNLMGFALWSPRLDPLGNTVRGVQFSRLLVERYNFHNYDILVNSDSNKIYPVLKNKTDASSMLDSNMYAARSGALQTLKWNALKGSNMNLADYVDRTPLHVAASNGHLEVIKFFVEECHVNVDVKDRWGRTPLDEAKYFNHEKCEAYLEQCRMELRTSDVSSPFDKKSR